MIFRLRFVGVFVCAVMALPGFAQSVLAPKPPMGWNSWDSYGLTINESQFRENVEWLKKNLQPYGWKYVVVDEGWYFPKPDTNEKDAWDYTVDPYGRFFPAPARFPSAADGRGFKPLADYVHSLGLKFGLHMIRGIPRVAVSKNLPIEGSTFHASDAANPSDTCPWNQDTYGVRPSAAGQAYYDSMARAYASWGLDYLKVDCISRHYKAEEIRMISLALKKTGRPIVLSLSPGPTPLNEADEVRKYAQMWRISNDVWDHWGPAPNHGETQGVLDQFALLAKWAPFVETGHWPDADMLPLGYIGPHPGDGDARWTKLTHDEQRTLLTLWSIARSPLMMGGNLPRSDAWTTALLTNAEVIGVDQNSRNGHPVVSTSDTIVWLAQPAKGDAHYLAVFNPGDSSRTIHYDWKAVQLDGGSYQMRDLWAHRNLGPAKSLDVFLRPHASALYRLTGR